jgi:hypothetical protein
MFLSHRMQPSPCCRSLSWTVLAQKYIGPLAPLPAKLHISYSAVRSRIIGAEGSNQCPHVPAAVAGLGDYLSALNPIRCLYGTPRMGLSDAQPSHLYRHEHGSYILPGLIQVGPLKHLLIPQMTIASPCITGGQILPAAIGCTLHKDR